MTLSIILLSYTKSIAIYEMTTRCIESLVASEQSNKNIQLEVIIIESNKNFYKEGFKYNENVKLIIPEDNFNFHKFLNIGIKASSGEYVALCNNDLIFYENWFSEILKVKAENPSIKSFSPFGNINKINLVKSFELGYKVRTHINGWCIITNIEIFKEIGYLDETFDFNYADNDYAMTLKKNNIKHAVVYNSKVEHLDKSLGQKIKENHYDVFEVSETNIIKLPPHLLTPEYSWVLNDRKGTLDHIKFHYKWGNPVYLYRKNKVADLFIKLGLGFLNKLIL